MDGEQLVRNRSLSLNGCRVSTQTIPEYRASASHSLRPPKMLSKCCLANMNGETKNPDSIEGISGFIRLLVAES